MPGYAGWCSVNDPPRKPHSMALAMAWVAKITTVSLEMSLPAIGGAFLDRRLGTRYWVLVGLVLGVTVGIWHLIQMTQPRRGNRPPRDPGNSQRGPAGR
jgi:hypothetical protein